MSSGAEPLPPTLSNRELKKKQAKQKFRNSANNKTVSKILSENLKGRKLTSIERTILDSQPDLVNDIKKRHSKRQIALARKRDNESEYIDDEEILQTYAKELAKLLYHCKENDKTVVCYTGAGISTAANIRDYRGPNGIWTELNRTTELQRPANTPENARKSSLTQAKPTKAHMILKRLVEKNYLDHILSQNCDGLHVRSGVPKEKLSEVHGNMYVEYCPNEEICGVGPIYRVFDVTEKTNYRRHSTGRFCPKCSEKRGIIDTPTELNDSIVHFGEANPAKSIIYPYNWLSAYRKIYPWWDGKDATWKSQVVNPNKKAAQKASKSKQKLGLILVLGSRCDVLKSYTHLWPKDFKNLVIVNLQKTSKDHLARIKVHAKCDEFLELVYKELHVLESADWEIPDLSEEERENYYTPTDVPEYSLSTDQLLTLATPVPERELSTINTLSIFRPEPDDTTEPNQVSLPPEKKPKSDNTDTNISDEEIFYQLPNSPLSASSKASTSKSSSAVSSSTSRSSTPGLLAEKVPEKFASVVLHIQKLKAPLVTPAWYGIGSKRKRK